MCNQPYEVYVWSSRAPPNFFYLFIYFYFFKGPWENPHGKFIVAHRYTLWQIYKLNVLSANTKQTLTEVQLKTAYKLADIQLNINSVGLHTNTGVYTNPPSSTCDIKLSILIHTSIHTACSHRDYTFLLIFKYSTQTYISDNTDALPWWNIHTPKK